MPNLGMSRTTRKCQQTYFPKSTASDLTLLFLPIFLAQLQRPQGLLVRVALGDSAQAQLILSRSSGARGF